MVDKKNNLKVAVKEECFYCGDNPCTCEAENAKGIVVPDLPEVKPDFIPAKEIEMTEVQRTEFERMKSETREPLKKVISVMTKTISKINKAETPHEVVMASEQMDLDIAEALGQTVVEVETPSAIYVEPEKKIIV